MKKNEHIFVAGHKGMVGSAVIKELKKLKYKNIITKNKKELDLINQKSVDSFFKKNKISCVILAAARVGGILANSKNQEIFLYENIMIQSNIIYSCHKYNINKLIFLGSSCIYPKNILKPIKENMLLTSKLEETNEGYALAKISGIKLCEFYNKKFNRDYICLMPTNLYGPKDNFDPKSSHVIPGLIHKIHKAKKLNKKNVVLWGTGKPLREFMHVDDLAKAIIFFLNLPKKKRSSNFLFNIGTKEELTIKNLSNIIRSIISYKGNIIFDKVHPDGVKKKLIDSSLAYNLGWKPLISLEKGLFSTYRWYLNNKI